MELKESLQAYNCLGHKFLKFFMKMDRMKQYQFKVSRSGREIKLLNINMFEC